MTKPPHYSGRLAGEPRPPPDEDHLWQQPAALLTRCVEGTQACHECAWIAAAVRVMLPDERPAARFVRLVLFHLPIRAIAAIRYVPPGPNLVIQQLDYGLPHQLLVLLDLA